MIAWLAANLGTVGITALLILIVAGIIRTMVRDKRQGRSTCGGNCAHCQMCTACRTKEYRTAKGC